MNHAQACQQHEEGPNRSHPGDHIHDHGLLGNDEVAGKHLKHQRTDHGGQRISRYLQDIPQISLAVQQRGHGPVADDEQNEAKHPCEENGDTVHGGQIIQINYKSGILIADTLQNAEQHQDHRRQRHAAPSPETYLIKGVKRMKHRSFQIIQLFF